MNKNNRGFCKKYKMTPREYRQLRHIGEMYAKEMKREIDRDKSRHDCLYTTPCEKDRKEHPSWYLNGRTFVVSTEGEETT